METMEALESHPDWSRESEALRRLARGLLGDAQAGDDAVQEAWLRAHTRAAGHPDEARPFWRRVVTNLAHDRRRGESRRGRREQAAARPEALPSTDEVVSRLELAQLAARAAAELDEPYRTTVHLRYFEDLSLTEIAERSGVPLETVRTRLRRGLERMRARLDRSARGGREAWCLALAPLALRSAREASPAAGATLVAATGGLLAVKKLALLAAAVALVLGSTWWRTSREAQRPKGVEVAAGVRPAPSAAESSEGLRGGPLAPVVAERTALASEPTHGAAPSPSPEVSGTIVLRDGAHGDRDDADGFLDLELVRVDGSREEAVFEVRAGRWRASVPRDVRLAFRRAYLAGRQARLVDPPVASPGSDAIALEAVAWPPLLVRVLDAATGFELDEVELRWSVSGHMSTAERHPGEPQDGDVRRLGLSSPFEFESPGMIWEETSVRLWVGAPGLAWTSVDMVPALGGMRTVALAPGGDLDVHVQGPRPDSPWIVVLDEYVSGSAHPSPHAAAQRGAQGPVTRYERLAPGRYRVRAMRYDFRGGDLGVGDPFDVFAGETTHVTLHLRAPAADLPRVHVAGTLTWPEGARVSDLHLVPTTRESPQEAVRLSLPEMQAIEGDPRARRWDAGLLVAGSYVIEGGGLRVVFDTGPGPELELALAIPPRVSVAVRALDARDGHVLTGARVDWSLQREDDGGYEMWSMESDATGQGLVRFEAPAVRLALSVDAPGWSPARLVVDAGTTLPETIDVPLERLVGLRLRLVEDGTPIPRTYATPHLTRLTGEPVAASEVVRDEHGTTIRVPPGIYRLTVERPDASWNEPAPIEVRVVDGTLTPVDVPLSRLD